MPDGSVIEIGGQNPASPGSFRNAVRWVKTWNANVGWTQLPDLQHPRGRWYPGLARLADGSFLVMGGGQRPDASRTATCERFDLPTRTWSYTAPMNNPVEYPPCALLYTGEVLKTWYPPELYDPASETWRPTGNFVQSNRSYPGHSDHSLLVLTDGRALALGTLDTVGPNPRMGEVYDPTTGQWSLTSNSNLPRFQSEVVMLPDGRVLAAGGESAISPPPVADRLGIVKWCDLYDPSRDRWRRVADMMEFREYHAISLLLPDARVTTTGGTRIKFQTGPTSTDIEAFEPPYLFRGERPRITSISTTSATRGSSLHLGIAPDVRLTSVVLVGLSSPTHWVDGGIKRRLELTVAQVGSQVSVTLPAGANVLPLGYYMLFAMVDDIPSAARIIRVL